MKHCLNTLQKRGKLKSKSKFNKNHIKSTVPHIFRAALRGKTWTILWAQQPLGNPRGQCYNTLCMGGGPKPQIVKS